MRTYGKKVSIPSAFVTCLLIVLIVFGTVGGEFYDGNTAKYWYNRGIEYYKSGEQEKAVDAFTLAIRIQPDHVQAHNRLGSVFRDLGRYREAIGAYQRAIRIKPDCADAHFDLGVTYSDVDVHDKAIKEFRETLQIDPEYVNVHYNLGISLYKLRHHKEAIEAFKRVIQKQPGSAEARYNLGINYLAENDKNAALVEYNILKNVDPERAQTLLSKIQNETRNTGMAHYNDLKD